MKLAFSTNAYLNFSFPETARRLAALGYAGLELMADVPHAWPAYMLPEQKQAIRDAMTANRLAFSNVNAFMMHAVDDKRQKYWHPSWIEPDPHYRRIRIEHTKRALSLAAELGAPCVTTEPGGPLEGRSWGECLKLFVEELKPVVEHAEKVKVPLLVEPEPDLLIETADQYLEFAKHISSPYLGLNFDIGHFYCVKDDPAATVRKLAPLIKHVHLEDIAATRVHHHLVPGEGVIDFRSTLAALKEVGYGGWVTIELYTYHENPDEAAKTARERVLGYAKDVGVVWSPSPLGERGTGVDTIASPHSTPGTMRNACPTCQTVYAVTPADVGRRIVCTRCNANLIIDDDGFRVTDGSEKGKPVVGSKAPPPSERVKEPKAKKPRPVEDDEDTVDSTDVPKPKTKRRRDEDEDDEDDGPPRPGPLDLFKRYVDLPTVVFAAGVVLVLWFLFMPIIGSAKLRWYTARIEDEQLALDLEVKRLEGNGQGEVAKKKREDWVKRKEKLESDVQWVQINNRQSEYWDRYGMLAGFVLTALGGIGLLMTHQPTVKKIVGAVVVCGMMILVFISFAWKG